MMCCSVMHKHAFRRLRGSSAACVRSSVVVSGVSVVSVGYMVVNNTVDFS